MAYENELNRKEIEAVAEEAVAPIEEAAEEVIEETAVETATEEAAVEPVEVLETAETGVPEVDAVAEDAAEVEAEELLSDDAILLESDDDDLLADPIDELDIEFEIEGEEKKTGVIAEKVQEVRNGVQEKYTEARTACRSLMDRLAKDMEETNYNPYIRSTTKYKYEILRRSDDTEPVDVFEFEKTSGYSLRAMAITSALVLAADVAVAKLLKKKFF